MRYADGIETKENKKINVDGREMLYRNNSTGNPTLIHFVPGEAEYGSTAYCGFTSLYAENVLGDVTDTVLSSQCCQKCLRLMDKHDAEINSRPPEDFIKANKL